mgnify:FL=1
MKINYSVKPILRTDKKRKDGKCPINLRVTLNSKVLKLPFGEYIEEINWNKKDACFKEAKTSISNEMLDKEVSRIKDYIREQRISGKEINLESIKNFYSNNNSTDLFMLYDMFCIKKFKTIASGTQEHYKLLKKRLLEFKPNSRTEDINIRFIERFDDFLKQKSKIEESGLFNRHKNLKTFILYLIKNNYLKDNPYKDFKMPQCKKKFGYVTETELEKIKNIDYSNLKNADGLKLISDMFLFACNTGLRYSDVVELKWENVIQMDHIILTTKKNNKTAVIPLTRQAKIILMQYKRYKTIKVFPERSNVHCNRELKVIAEICDINKNVTFHMGRHTFATILANNNVNPFHIAQLMTHSSMKQTMTYVNSSVGALNKSIENIGVFK